MKCLYRILLDNQMRLLQINVSREANRYGLSDRATASVCTALLRDIELMTGADHAITIDKNKVRRERQAFRNNLVRDVHSTLTDKDDFIDAIYFDKEKIKF